MKIGGTHIGSCNKDCILSYFTSRGVDVSELRESDFEGAVDHVIIAGNTRTCLGEFGKYAKREKPWYEPASEESIKNCQVAAIDLTGIQKGLITA